MAHQTKIATCCYCGTRAALVLKGRERHELACSNCGAPLHEMKMLKTARTEARRPQKAYPSDRPERSAPSRRRKKKSKSLSQRIMGEIWDVAEDVFDDIFD